MLFINIFLYSISYTMENTTALWNTSITKICVTWWPCAWKTTALQVLKDHFSKLGYQTFICPETATSLINWWVTPRVLSINDFQWLLMDKQLSEEYIYNTAAIKTNQKSLILYDRWICDWHAYMDDDLYEKLLNERWLTQKDAYQRYDAIIHLVTAALWAEKYYQRNDWKWKTWNNSARFESPNEAISLDNKTKNAWKWHRNLIIIWNDWNFNQKMWKVIQAINKMLWDNLKNEK